MIFKLYIFIKIDFEFVKYSIKAYLKLKDRIRNLSNERNVDFNTLL